MADLRGERSTVDPKAKEMITVAAPDDGRPSTAEADNVKLSIVILTFARDETLKATLAHLRGKLGRREDIEIVLVDNNTDSLDRTELLSAFPVVQVVKTMINKGVSARNDGMAAARGAYIALLDDDVLVGARRFSRSVRGGFRRRTRGRRDHGQETRLQDHDSVA